MLHTIPENQLRGYCKEMIESLELWLRSIINQVLSNSYGTDYLSFQDNSGKNIINTSIRNHISTRINHEPARFPRPIDACLLETSIDIITNPELYKYHFKDVFTSGFPQGCMVLKEYMSRLIVPRNKLSHATPISIREAEQVICYSNDIISCIKEYFILKNLYMQYNVPSIIQFSDSFGNTFYRSNFDGRDGSRYVNFNSRPEFYLRPGNILTMEIEVDSSFEENEYAVQWEWCHIKIESDLSNKKRVVVRVQNKHVGELATLNCRIISNKDWHRHSIVDDIIDIRYKVLPPL